MANFQRTSAWWGARRFGSYCLATNPLTGACTDGAEYLQIARPGELVPVSRRLSEAGTTVYASQSGAGPGSKLGTIVGSVQAPAGAFRCEGAAFGVGSGVACGYRWDDLEPFFEPPPGNAVKVADENQGFRTTEPGTVYFRRGPPNMGNDRGFVTRLPEGGSWTCNQLNFGPDPRPLRPFSRRECWFVPSGALQVEQGAPMTAYANLAADLDAAERAQAAAQAQRDMQAAQDRVFAERQAADYAAEQAQIAQNAQAQQAAALAAAEAYRQVQEEAHRQAADYAAELAALAAASAADLDAARAAAEVTAQAEALRQALAEAQAHQAEQQAAYDAALAATQAEMRNQEQANARLDAAENAADQAAANAAAGGAAGGVMSGDLLLYGGLAALAALLILVDEK